MLKTKKRSSGFTLAEMMISIGIIAILATIILFATREVRARARYTHAVASLEMITAAAGMYRSIHKTYPSDTADMSFVSDYYSEVPEPPCPGWKYDWQNWPDIWDLWGGSGLQIPEGAGKYVKIDLYDNNNVRVLTKCVYTEPQWICDPDDCGATVFSPPSGYDYKTTKCCDQQIEDEQRNSTCEAEYPAVNFEACEDYSSITNNKIYCN